MKHKKNRLLVWAVAGTMGISGLFLSVNQTVQAEETAVITEEQNVQADEGKSESTEKIYGIGSISKVYVTTAVMKLSEEGKVNLDAPVTEYIPEFTMADERYNEITVRMLMNHTSGIMGTSNVNMMLYADNDMSYHDELLASLAGQRLKADPGAYSAYCNDGFGLLEIIVENVSGMSYTEYIDRYIVSKIGAENTGTPVNRFQMTEAVPVYKLGNIPYDYDYCMNLGSGGVLSTASEVADFGSLFFEGNDTLLTENSKDEMASCWTDESYLDQNGSGWDYVESLQYEEAGVTVWGKGGDINNQHAHLMVAPDEEISVAVLSSGGSSTYNALMAQALLNVVLEERGIEVEDASDESVDTVLEVAKEYAKYEGYYATSGEIWNISFPNMKYMHLEKSSYNKTVSEDYMLTTDGRFVRMESDLSEWADEGYPEQTLRQDSNQVILTFEEMENGRVYIKADELIRVNGLGNYKNQTYVAENLEENPVSEHVQTAWETRHDGVVGLYNHKYSSANYDAAIAKCALIEEVPGYLFISSGGFGMLLKITGTDTAEAFLSIPSSVSRDLMDLKVESVSDENGASFEVIRLSSGDEYQLLEGLPELTDDVKEISLYSDEATWYYVGDDMASNAITFTRPEESAIYVYNKYGEMVYSTHMQDWTGGVPLPKDGFIVFLGEDGGVINITN